MSNIVDIANLVTNAMSVLEPGATLVVVIQGEDVTAIPIETDTKKPAKNTKTKTGNKITDAFREGQTLTPYATGGGGGSDIGAILAGNPLQ